MRAPNISVVIPCHNAESYIVAAVRSVLAQGLEGLETIVVDDGSTDRSVAVLRRAFSNVRIVEQANRGVAAARNTGLEHARGDWIAFLDADDVWLPGKLQAQRRLLAAAPDARMCYTAWHVWSSTEPEASRDLQDRLSERSSASAEWQGPSGWIYPELLLECAVWTSTVLAHRSLFEEAGVFDTSLRIGEDWDLWLRLSRVTPMLRVCSPYALYRLHDTSITRRAPERNFKALLIGRAVDRWGYRAPDGRSASKADVARAISRSWSDYALANLLAGNVARARQGCLVALRTDPIHLANWKVLGRSLLSSAIGPPRNTAHSN